MHVSLTALIEYGHYCNQQLITILEKNMEIAGEKSIKLMSHIINAENVWISRVKGVKPKFSPWLIHHIDDMRSLDQQNYVGVQSLINSRSGEEIIKYKNSEGESFQNTLKDILFHVVNHGTYHRGQIAAECQAKDIEPTISDFIFYKRG